MFPTIRKATLNDIFLFTKKIGKYFLSSSIYFLWLVCAIHITVNQRRLWLIKYSKNILFFSSFICLSFSFSLSWSDKVVLSLTNGFPTDQSD
jgi:hypothetical protein